MGIVTFENGRPGEAVSAGGRTGGRLGATMARISLWLLMGLAGLLPAVGNAQTTVKYVHADALGSVVAMTDATGAIIETAREYEPYGQQLVPAIHDGPGYTGHVQDAATGLVYMQQRYYDPGIGRFLSVDPVTAYDQPITNFCRYCYARNNPYKFNDPDGRAAQAVWGAVIGAGVEIFIQTQIQGKSFGDIDVSDVAVAAGAGALTGGIASAAALSAAKGAVTVGRAVAQTSAGSGAVGVTASLAKDVANGEAPRACYEL